jgi:small subunit ribosomal protein S21
MTTVTLRPNETVEIALRRFRLSVKKFLKELRARMAFEKPNERGKRKMAAALARQRKRAGRALPPKKM